MAEIQSQPNSEIKNDSTIIVANLNPVAKKNKYQKHVCGRLVHSNYKITINTNKRFRLDDPNLIPFVKKFYGVLKDIFDNDNVKRYIKINDPNVNWNTKWWNELKTVCVIERGDQSDCIHAHILIIMSHRTSVKLLYDDIKNDIKTGMDIDGNIYFHCDLIRRNIRDNFLEYIYKDVDPNNDNNKAFEQPVAIQK